MLRLLRRRIVEVPALPTAIRTTTSTSRDASPTSFARPKERRAVRRSVEQPRQPSGALSFDRPGNLGGDQRHHRRLRLLGRHRRTLAGTSIFLREEEGHRDRRRRSARAAMYNLFSTGLPRAPRAARSPKASGSAASRRSSTTHQGRQALSDPRRGSGADHLRSPEHEGLCLGGSSGINVAGAIRLAKDLGPGKTIVTVLADSGTRYQSKLFNPEFLRSKKLPVPAWLEKKSNVEIPFEKA